MWERAVLTHLITSQHVLPLMLERPGGLVVEVTDGVGSHYRGNLAFDLVKTAVNRLAFAQAEELRPHGLTALAISPGLLRSEAMLDGFSVTEPRGARRPPTRTFTAGAARCSRPGTSPRSTSCTTSTGSRPHWGRRFTDHNLGTAA